jgi:dolichol-phosphate mannosyltransferase
LSRGAPVKNSVNKDLENNVFMSAVVPFFNEEGNAVTLVTELEQVLAGVGKPFEVICVDDCSSDGTAAELHALKAGNPSLRVLRHRGNLGQSAAIATGFKAARGELVITLDGDGQNDPASIPAMLEALGPDVAAVCGLRVKRNDSAVKRISSRLAGLFRNRVIGDSVMDSGCGLRVIRRRALAEIPIFNGMHRFLPSLLRFQGHRVVEIPVLHRVRRAGLSKYGIGNRLWRGIRDCMAIRWYKARCLPSDRLDPDGGA